MNGSTQPPPTDPIAVERESRREISKFRRVMEVSEIRRQEDTRKREEFIAWIPEREVLQLASSFRHGQPCHFFRSPRYGEYSASYFVQFEGECGCQDGKAPKWVVSVPLEPCLPEGGRNKLEREVASMQLVAEKTTIPIPKIRAYRIGAADDIRPLSSYLITDFVEGVPINVFNWRWVPDWKRTRILASLADIYMQLRRLEFPAIGSLARHPDGARVDQLPASTDVNKLRSGGIQTSRIESRYGGEGGPLRSADEYISMLLDMADAGFAESQRRIVSSERGGDLSLYHLDLFRKHAQGWTDHGLDRGPFVLAHGNMSITKVVLGRESQIVGVLGWGWSRVVPRQLFHPPLWIHPQHIFPHALTTPTVYTEYLGYFDQLVAIMRQKEQERYGNELLSNEWTAAKENAGFMVAYVLENQHMINDFCSGTLLGDCKDQKEMMSRVEAFILEDPNRRAMVQRKHAKYELDLAAVRSAKRGKREETLTNNRSVVRETPRCALPTPV